MSQERTEWKPGAVALIGCPDTHRVALRMGSGSWGTGEGVFADATIGEARPLVVIDPESREQVERLAARIDLRCMGMLPTADEYADAVGAALRSLVAPPKPDEPTSMSARVIDASGAEWARSGRGCWFALGGQADCLAWDSLVERGPLEVTE